MPQPASPPLPLKHVRAAPSHRDPYGFYRGLLEAPISWDPIDECWVVAQARRVEDLLNDDRFLTRPPGQRVPGAFQGGAMATLFGALVRLNDGARHESMKAAIVAALGGLDLRRVDACARNRALELDLELGLPIVGGKLSQFAFALGVQTIAELLGAPSHRRSDFMARLDDYSKAANAAVAGTALDRDVIENGHGAAAGLLDMMGAMVEEAEPSPLLAAFCREAEARGCARDDIVANAVGFMIQSYASIASLIGLSLLALSRDGELEAMIVRDPTRLPDLVEEVLRFEPSTSTTIRYAAKDLMFANKRIKKGQAVIVCIAAANRDPHFNPDPDTFNIARKQRRYLEFGVGAHQCPAKGLAPRIAVIALDHLVGHGLDLGGLEKTVRYNHSAHVRIPMF